MRAIASTACNDWSALLRPPARQDAPPPRTVVAVAHPDDETIALGPCMPRMRDATFVYATDGAPRRIPDALAAGFGNCAEYACARRAELAGAFAVAGLDMRQAHFCDLPDQDAVRDLVWLTRRLKRVLERTRASLVITHPYEGGHPDHDAAAFGVHTACRLLALETRPAPIVLEAPFYHNRCGRMATGGFLPHTGNQGQVVKLNGEERALKRRLLECFRTQARTLGAFPTDRQCLRAAPAYDFEQPPHAGTLLYEAFGWGMTGLRWRQLAGEALAALGLPHGERRPMHGDGA